MNDTTLPTLAAALGGALDAYADLTALGEEVDDEWSYVNDLSAAWRERFEAVVSARGAETLDPPVVVAIEAAIAEITRIEDPHRAIDWLSTFPQVTLLALGETP